MQFSKRRLRWFLGLFFIALVIPSTVLTWQAYSRLKWESFHRYQVLADELLGRVDRRLREMVAKEERRSFTDYRFLGAESGNLADDGRRSPLADFPVNSEIPGLLGYFQVDAAGRFTTPLLPEDARLSLSEYGIPDGQLKERRAVREQMLAILSGQRGAMVAGPEEAATATVKDVQVATNMASSVADDRPDAPAMTPAITEDSTDLTGATSDGKKRESRRRTEVRSDDGQLSMKGAEKEQELAQAAFDLLSEPAARQQNTFKRQTSRNIGRVDELKLDPAFDDSLAAVQQRRPLPKFQERVEYDAASPAPGRDPSAIAPPGATRDEVPAATGVDTPALVNLFESEVDPFAFDLIDDDHFVLYRRVWRQGQPFIQGAVIDKQAWLGDLVEAPFRDTLLAGMSRLGIVFDNEILSALGGTAGRSYLSRSEDLSGTLLYRGRLSSPLDRLELIFSVTRMPAGSAGALVIWVAVTLGLLLLGGFLLMYRLAVKQIELGQQQRDFVSAVSHELKTPLTSIRMYSEMLREGWGDEARRRSYYAFIHDESERLSRLIANVLQLARMSRNELQVDPRPVRVGQLIDLVQSKVSTQIEQAGFALEIACKGPVRDLEVSVDVDAFAQIVINLVDNAIKFAARARRRVVRLEARPAGGGHVEIAIRDYGPGIPRDQMKKIFRLFYRSENELTRETVGTGIGLALVQRLTTAMDGEVDVVNREPGAEFRLRFARF